MSVDAPAERPPAGLRAGLDRLARLPDWLAATNDRERLRAALVERVPEFAAGAPALRGCEAKRLRLEGGRWTGLLRLTIDGPGTRVVNLAATLTPPGTARPGQLQAGSPAVPFGDPAWRCTLPELGLELATEPPDEALAALPQLTDPVRAGALLQEGVRAAAPAYADFRIAACTPRVVRYKPGSRATILYDLDYAPADAGRGWPAVVVAKTYDGDKGANAYAGMRALWATELAGGDVVRIAEPLAYLPEDKVLVQRSIPEEQTLKQLLRAALRARTAEAAAGLDEPIAKTAAGLAALHACGVEHGVTVTIADELAEVRELAAGLAATVGAVRGAAEPLLDWVEAMAASHPADPAVPTHRSFRPAQVLLHQGRIGFIDFDGFCQAEPALDLALFRASVKDVVMDDLIDSGLAFERPLYLERLTELDAICDAFSDRYAALGSVSPVRVRLWETLDLVTNVLNCWTKVKPEVLPTTMLLLEHHLWPAP